MTNLLLTTVGSFLLDVQFLISFLPFFFSAPSDYEGTQQLLTFSPTILSVQVPVTIFNDSIVEGDETFFGNLDARGQPANTNPAVASVLITEDPSDSKDNTTFRS